MSDAVYFKEQARALGAELSSETCGTLLKYLGLILEANKSVNLTAVTNFDDAVIKHLLDSVSLLGLPELMGSVADVGTGAGFPGAVLAAADSSLAVTLIDSTEKKLRIVDGALRECGIKNAATLHARAEELGRDGKYRESYDTVTARAVANLASLAEYCLPLVRVGGFFLAMKGERASEEARQAKGAIETLGGEITEIKELTLPDSSSRGIVIVKKISQTPPKYPRSGKNIAKTPITCDG